jgi:hypothetical protein
MPESRHIQGCVVCAWRSNCNKRFCVPDGGAKCPDFTRDVSIKDQTEEQTAENT